jgi:hypothetical protein
MSKGSRESAPDVTDYGPAEDRGAQLDGYVVIFTSIRKDCHRGAHDRPVRRP